MFPLKHPQQLIRESHSRVEVPQALRALAVDLERLERGTEDLAVVDELLAERGGCLD